MMKRMHSRNTNIRCQWLYHPAPSSTLGDPAALSMSSIYSSWSPFHVRCSALYTCIPGVDLLMAKYNYVMCSLRVSAFSRIILMKADHAAVLRWLCKYLVVVEPEWPT